MGFSIVISLVSIWALANFDGLNRAARTRSVATLLVMRWLHNIFVLGIHISVGTGAEYMAVGTSAAYVALPTIILTLIILGLTYLVRVRQPDERSGALTEANLSLTLAARRRRTARWRLD